MTYHITSNLFDSTGHLDSDGDEDQVNTGHRSFTTFEAAADAAETLAARYPNAIVDVA